MYELTDDERYILQLTEEGRKFLEYHAIFKSKPFGYGVGCPNIDKYGGIVGLYDECIKQNKPWEELLPYSKWDELEAIE